ncbi:TPA: hypothetical protein ACT2FU_000384 [Streptococcus suis]
MAIVVTIFVLELPKPESFDLTSLLGLYRNFCCFSWCLVAAPQFI